MTFNVLGITISVNRSKPADHTEPNWYPGAEKALPQDFFEEAQTKAIKLWTQR